MIEPNSYYIIVQEGENQDNLVSPNKSAGSSFSYTLNGKKYTMRYLTVTAADNSSYGQASIVNLMKSKTKSVIKSCLDATITTIASAASSSAGLAVTVAQLCGLSISNFSTAQKSTLILFCSSNWTRKYAQIYDKSHSCWVSGSCVEYVKTRLYVDGDYYCAATNSYKSVPKKEKIKIIYSSKYNDSTWIKNNAVSGYNRFLINYNTTGDVKFKYNGTQKAVHHENF